MKLFVAEKVIPACYVEEWLKDRENKDARLFSVIMKLAETKPDLFKNMMRMDSCTFKMFANLIRPLVEKKIQITEKAFQWKNDWLLLFAFFYW